MFAVTANAFLQSVSAPNSQKNASLRQVVDFLATQSKPPGKFFAGNKVAISTPHNRKNPFAGPPPLCPRNSRLTCIN
jgi:hypothetical protein